MNEYTGWRSPNDLRDDRTLYDCVIDYSCVFNDIFCMSLMAYVFVSWNLLFNLNIIKQTKTLIEIRINWIWINLPLLLPIINSLPSGVPLHSTLRCSADGSHWLSINVTWQVYHETFFLIPATWSRITIICRCI